MRIKKVSFEEACPTIQYSFQLETSDPNQFRHILIANFSGKYRYGSKGNPDAALMWGVLKTACELWYPRAVIIDLRDFEYNWGDKIEMVFDAPGDATLAIVVGEKCRDALSTLEYGLDTDKDITESKYFFDSLEEALNCIQQFNSEVW